MKLERFCEKLDYHFRDVSLLEVALSHRSAEYENHNERFEFLGDSILNFVIAEKLFQIFPQATEGELSRFRASMVNKKTLVVLAKELEVSHYLRLGLAEIKNGGAKRESILADTLEAVIGAIYLDGGIEKCQEKILQWYAPHLQEMIAVPVGKDAKTQLQEYFQARQLSLPSYCVTSIVGKSHAQVFHVECFVEGFDYVGRGNGHSRREAEQMAAKQYLDWLLK